jgi:hypothetical protein
MYMDWGFEIQRDGETVFYNPCFLSAESYGFYFDDMVEGQEEAEEWNSDDWQSAIIDLLDEMAPDMCGDFKAMPW